MATYPVPAVGQRLTAAFITSMLPTTARKAADTSRASTTVLAADPDLALAVEANAVYGLEGCFFHSGAIAPSISINHTFPAGTTGHVGYAGQDTSGTGGDSNDQMKRNALGTLTNFNNKTGGAAIIYSGIVVTAGTAGTLTVIWAQVVSNATATILLTNSWMKLTRIG